MRAITLPLRQGLFEIVRRKFISLYDGVLNTKVRRSTDRRGDMPGAKHTDRTVTSRRERGIKKDKEIHRRKKRRRGRRRRETELGKKKAEKVFEKDSLRKE